MVGYFLPLPDEKWSVSTQQYSKFTLLQLKLFTHIGSVLHTTDQPFGSKPHYEHSVQIL